MNIQKAHWSADANGVRLSMPLSKVDQENRIVSGFATLDNVDTSDDVVLASASRGAFEGFRGNIRLMHQPIPAGKLVNFREEDYYDAESGKFYQGIYVDVYVSKGAPEIWEMVLDGTLTGFSIGGNITDQESQYVADAGKVIRFIKAYDLIELSLVDSPANQLSNIFSITKSAGTTEMSGPLSEVVAENVFWCGNDKIAFTSQDEARDCNVCGKTTENIGWFESDGGDKTEKVNSIVASFKKADTVERRENIMADEITETDEVAVEAPVVAEEEVVETDAEVAEEEVAEAAEELEEEIEEVVAEIDAEIEELEAEANADADTEVAEDDTETAVVEEEVAVEKADTPDFAAMISEFSDQIQKALEATADATAEQLTKVNDKIAAIEAVATKIDELAGKQAALEEKFRTVATQVESVEKALGTIEKGVGIKKSGDLGGSKEETKLEKAKGSIWGGRFFGSVDNI